MRNTLRTLTVVAALGALAPLAAHADSGMYQPSPLITHTQSQHHDRTAMNNNAARNTQANTQTNASQRNG